MLNVLVLAEHFPNTIQPWLLNWLEEILRHDGDVHVAAHGTLDDVTPKKVLQLGLLQHTEYYQLTPVTRAIGRMMAYVLPFTERGRRAYAGLRRLRSSYFTGSSSTKAAIKAALRSSILVPGSYDVVHSHTLGMSYEYLFVIKALNIPLVTTFHGLPPAGVRLLRDDQLAEVFDAGALFLVNTEFAKTQLRSLGCPEQKISILPQGTRLQEFPFVRRTAPTSGRTIVLTVGRYHTDKGQAYALKAIANLVRRGVNVEYRLVGAGPEEDTLRRMIVDEGLSNNAFVLGLIDDAALRQQYREAHIFVLPSLRDKDGVHEETQGVVIQEAQASGVLVVATRTGGIPECVIDGENAFIVPDRDSEAIENRIASIIAHPEMWQTWQDNARQHVEQNFAIEKLGDRMWVEYNKLVDANHARTNANAGVSRH